VNRKIIALLIVLCSAAAQGAQQFPLALAADTRVTRGATTVTTTFAIHIDRVMNETFRTRVTDALKFGGYLKFLPALRALPAIGTIEFDGRTVELRYVREEPRGEGSRLVLVADQPLFFLDKTKTKAGYELTMVDLTLDAQGSGTGMMAGAARIKPTGDGGVAIDDFAVEPVKLTVRRVSAK